jgi:cobalt-zinc-cadmium efflux system membrane fusion protein
VKKSMAIGLVLGTAAILAGCGRFEGSDAPKRPDPASNAPAEAVVELTGSQTNAVKVASVGTYLFPVEEAAVGGVSFAEDPAIVQAESTLVSAAATFNSTGKELARVTSLGETNGIAPKEIEQATADHQTAEASLNAARGALRVLGVTDGEIDQMVSVGKIESPPAGQHWVIANVSENNSPLLRTGQVVRVRVKAFPGRAFDGKVSRIYATVDPNIHRQLIRCVVEDSKDELRPGMLADVVIHVKDPVEATAIPAEGVVRESDGTMTAWVTSDGHKFLQRKIKIGLQTDGRYQVLDGLKPGEMAVTEGAVFLSNILNAPPGDD